MTAAKIQDELDLDEALADFLEKHPEWHGCPDLIVSPPSAEEIKEYYPDCDFEVLDKCEQLTRYGVTRGAIYMRLRSEGQNHKWSAMCALQKGPVLSTDDTFFQGAKPLYDQFGSQKHLDGYLKASARHGFVPDKNAVYFPNLARFKGDPEAYVTRAQGRAYIRNLLEKRGWSAEGGVNVKGRGPESDPLDPKNCKALGEDIIRDRMGMMIAKNPDLKKVDRRELRQQIIDKHGAK